MDSVYQDVRGKIEKTDAYKEMKAKMVEISQKVNVIDRAIRLSNNARFVEYLEAEKEELKNDPALKDYDKFMDAMEIYSGAKIMGKKVGDEKKYETYRFLKDKFGVKSRGDLHYDIHDQVSKFSNPKSINIEFENFDTMINFKRILDGKNPEELEAETPNLAEQKNMYLPCRHI